MTEVFLESLEPRIAPAALINPKTVEYQDIDGDIVQVKVSKGELSLDLFTFTSGDGGSEILTSLDLTLDIFAKSTVSITAKTPRGGGGDGFVDVGAILAAGVDLGKVTVDGGLQKIEAGDNATLAKGLDGLQVGSLGTLDEGIFGANRTSTIMGKLGGLAVKGNMGGTLFNTGGVESGIAKVEIGGSLVGGTGSLGGWISSTGDIGSVKIKQNIDGHLADSNNEAGIFSSEKIKSVEVGGSVIAGAFNYNGIIFATKDIDKVKIAGDLGRSEGTDAGEGSGSVISETGKIGSVFVGGDLLGGSGKASGHVGTGGSIAKVQIVGDAKGGGGEASGAIKSEGTLGAVSLGGDLLGGVGEMSGSVTANGDLFTSIKIAGKVQGDEGLRSGSIFALNGAIGTVSIGQDLAGYNGDIEEAGELSGTVFALKGIKSISLGGSLEGGAGDDSGTIQTGPAQGVVGNVNLDVQGNIGTVKIAGDAQGNSGLRSGAVLAWGSDMGTATIGGSVIGGAGQFSALIYGMNNFTKATVGGDVLGGTGPYSGRIATDAGNLGTVSIGGRLEGNSADNSATVHAGGTITKVTVGEDVKGGSGMLSGSITAGSHIGTVAIGSTKTIGSLIGGAGGDSGSIKSDGGNIDKVTITGGLDGGEGSRTASINAFHGSLGVIKINGSVTGNSGFFSGSLWGQTGINTVTIGGGLLGGAADQTGLVISNGALQAISVGESVVGSDYNNTGTIRGYKGIGKVFIGGNLEGGNNSEQDTFYTGAIVSGGLDTESKPGETLIVWGVILSLEIKGDIIAGEKVDAENELINSGAIRATGQIGKLTVGGSLIGNATNQIWITAFANPFLAEPAFFTKNSTIGAVTIKGDVSYSLIAAGIIDAGNPLLGAFPFAQIASVTVGGSWTASSIVAGADPGPDGFGSGDHPTFSAFDGPAGSFGKIGKIAIKKAVTGGAEGEQYGFVASSFGSISANGHKQTIPATGTTTDVTADGSVKIHTILPYFPPI